MTAPLYTRDILRLAASIPYLAGREELDGATEVRSPTCGSRLRIAVEMDDAGRVVSLRQWVEACAFGQAAANLMASHAAGRTRADVAAALAAIEAWLAGDESKWDSWPGLTVLEPARARTARHGAMLLPFRGLLEAMK